MEAKMKDEQQMVEIHIFYYPINRSWILLRNNLQANRPGL